MKFFLSIIKFSFLQYFNRIQIKGSLPPKSCNISKGVCEVKLTQKFRLLILSTNLTSITINLQNLYIFQFVLINFIYFEQMSHFFCHNKQYTNSTQFSFTFWYYRFTQIHYTIVGFCV